jgi:hypothetical protein
VSASPTQVNTGTIPKPSSRDLRFDTLRGLFLVCMTINHLPTTIRKVTDQSLGVFTAAEGFVFLSGLLAGWVYTRKLREGGARGLWKAVSLRATTIYRWHIVSFVGAFLSVQVIEHATGFCSTNVPRLFFQHPAEALGLGLTLLYQPGLLDLLPMYCVFVAFLPIVIHGLESGRRWLVLSVSAALWLVIQWAPPVDGAPLYPVNTGSFNLLAWQFIFVAGVAIGHARLSGQAQVAKPNPWVVSLAAALAVYAFGIRQFEWTSLWPDRVFGLLLNKPALGLLRIGDFAAVAYLVAILGERFPRALSIPPLEFLGRHSLVVVATQSVAIMTVLQFPSFTATEFDRTLVAVAMVAAVFATAGVQEAVQARRRTGASSAGNPVSPPGGGRLSSTA